MSTNIIRVETVGLLHDINHDNAPTQLPITYTYDTRDPLAVVVAFHTNEHKQPVRWTFARTLIADALACFTEIGEGDVKVIRYDTLHCAVEFFAAHVAAGIHGDVLEFELSSPDGIAIVTTSASDANRWLNSSKRVMPLGAEPVDVDGCIAAIWAKEGVQ